MHVMAVFGLLEDIQFLFPDRQHALFTYVENTPGVKFEDLQREFPSMGNIKASVDALVRARLLVKDGEQLYVTDEGSELVAAWMRWRDGGPSLRAVG